MPVIIFRFQFYIAFRTSKMPKRKAKPVVKTPQNKKAKTSKPQKTDKSKKNTNVRSAKMSSGKKTTLDKKLSGKNKKR